MMYNKPAIAIDGSLLAVPSIGCTLDDVHGYIDRLLDWGGLLSEPEVEVLMSEQMNDALVDDGIYPLRPDLSDLLRAHGVIEYDVNTIAQVTERLLSRVQSFEEAVKIREVLVDEIITEPNILARCKYPACRRILERTVVSIGMLRSVCSDPYEVPLTTLDHKDHQVKLSVKIHDVEHSRVDFGVIPMAPKEFQTLVKTFSNVDKLIERIEAGELLKNVGSQFEFGRVLKLILFKYRRKQGVMVRWDEFDPEIPRIGGNFLRSMRDCLKSADLDLVDRIARAISETVYSENLSAVHDIRKSKDGGAKTLTREPDKAKAMRRDIDRSYHLHYWECKDGNIELADVLPYGSYKITE